MKGKLNPNQRRAVTRLCQRIREDGALRAALRRAASPDDVIGLEAVVRFGSMWRPQAQSEYVEPDAVLEALAILLAHRSVKVVSHDESTDESEAPSGESLAERFGRAEQHSALLSPLRFQRLIHAREVEERLRHLRRALGLLSNRSLHPLRLAEAWRQLNSEDGRRVFARDYFAPMPNIQNSATSEVTP